MGGILISNIFPTEIHIIICLQHVLILQIPTDAWFPPSLHQYIRIKEYCILTVSTSDVEMSPLQKKYWVGIMN